MLNETCEAVVRVTDGGGVSARRRRGEPCGRDACSHVRHGEKLRPVCWVHLQAAANPERAALLEFAE